MIGGRLGYVLFYDLAKLPAGSALHFCDLARRHVVSRRIHWRHDWPRGFCRRKGWNFWEIADLVCVAVPIGLGLGRIGNFINGELFGRPTNVPWAMVFPDGGAVPRHPSQLYEALLEGLVLFLILALDLPEEFLSGNRILGAGGFLRFVSVSAWSLSASPMRRSDSILDRLLADSC